jgi:hypothetical protein
LAEIETIDLLCGKCQAPMRVHKPVMVRADNGMMSQIALIPTWSLDERKCNACGAINAPVFVPQLSYAWMAFEAPKEVPGSRIIEPTGNDLAVLRNVPRRNVG